VVRRPEPPRLSARSLLGDNGWANLRARLKDTSTRFSSSAAGGRESFKGSGFVRGGIYDRIQVKQGADAFTFRDLDYLNLYGLEAAGAPAFTESAIFIVRSEVVLGRLPVEAEFLGNRVDRATGARSFANFDAPTGCPRPMLEGGRPKVEEARAPWVRIWKTRARRDRPVRAAAGRRSPWSTRCASADPAPRTSNKWPVNAFKYSAWAISIGFVGFGRWRSPRSPRC
jgi:NosR/NirI family nitrous oxide reductase transcriptional regulator